MESQVTLTRRATLKVLAAGIGASLVASCAPKATPAPAAAPTAAPQAAPPTAAPAQPAAKAPSTVVVMYGRAELSDDEIKLCEEKYPQLKIEYLETDGTRFMAMLAAGDPPDYTRNNAVDTAYWVNKKALLDMTPYVETSTKIKWDDLHPVGEMYRYADGFYGIMKDWGASFSVWAYVPVWEEAGVELPASDKPMPLQFYREASAKLTKREGDRVLMFGWDVAWDAGHFQKALAPLGATIFSEQFDKVMIKDNPVAVEFLKFLTDWQMEKTCVSPINPSEKGFSGELLRATLCCHEHRLLGGSKLRQAEP